MQKLSDWVFAEVKAFFAWLRGKEGWAWESSKFALRLFILIGIPQLLAWTVSNPGVWWANLLSALLPVIDKAWHESDLKGNGLLAF